MISWRAGSDGPGYIIPNHHDDNHKADTFDHYEHYFDHFLGSLYSYEYWYLKHPHHHVTMSVIDPDTDLWTVASDREVYTRWMNRAVVDYSPIPSYRAHVLCETGTGTSIAASLPCPDTLYGYSDEGSNNIFGNGWRDGAHCVAPSDGSTWVIRRDCVVRNRSVTAQDVRIEDGAILTIAAQGTLDIDLSEHNIRVAPDSMIRIEPGGTLK